MSGNSKEKKDKGWLEKTTIDVAVPGEVKTTVVNKDGTYTQNARLGDYIVETRVKYPTYYMFRHKHDKDSLPEAIVVIKTVEEDVGFPTEIGVFIRKNFIIQKLTKEEAETYDAIGVAPFMSPVEFAKYLSGIHEDIGKRFTEAGIKERNGVVRRGEHTYDLSPNISHIDLENKS